MEVLFGGDDEVFVVGGYDFVNCLFYFFWVLMFDDELFVLVFRGEFVDLEMFVV